MFFGLLLAFAGLTIVVLAFPLRRDLPYDPVIGRTALLLHGLFFVVMLAQIPFVKGGGASEMVIAPDTNGIEANVQTVTLTVDASPDLVGGASRRFVVVDPTVDENGKPTNAFATALRDFNLVNGVDVVRDETGARPFGGGPVTVLIRRNQSFLEKDPELVIWIPTIAAVSSLMFLLPYLDCLKRRISKNPRRPWILSL
jgi:hypothetical protein